MTREADDLVDHYLLEWDSRGWANAYHSLIELGPQILPEVSRRFATSHDAAFRAALVALAQQVHSSDALPLFDRALRDESPEVWKEALDGLVALASPPSILMLEEALRRPAPGRTSEAEWRSWIREALQQARAQYEAHGGVA